MKNLCLDCPDIIRGLCCHASIDILGFNVVLDAKCPYLTDARLCANYEKRYLYNLFCVDGLEGQSLGALPVGCKYINGFDGPRPKQTKKYILKEIRDKKTKVKFIKAYTQFNSMSFEELHDND